MSGNYTGRGVNAGPATEFYPLSAATASSPSILVTATTAGAQNTIHTADANAQDVLFVTISNVGTATVDVFTNIGSTATTGQISTRLTSGSYAVILSANMAISKSGVVGMWATATSGIYAFGYVARTYTATS